MRRRQAQAEIDEELVRRSKHEPRRLGCDQRLEVQDVDKARFDELRLRQRCGHAQDGLVGEKDCALGHGMNVAVEAKPGQIIQQVLSEPAGACQKVELGAGETKMFKIIERLLEARGQQKSAPHG
jgi:hypothetical protein